MQELKFYRKGKTIFNAIKSDKGGFSRGDVHTTFKFYNEAKRLSAELQRSNGGLGMGSLAVTHE